MRKAVAFAHVLPEHSGAAAGAVLSASSRLLQLGKELQALKEAASSVLENMWPDAPVPETLQDLSVQLDGASVGIDEQMEMAAWGSTDMALALVMSWYPDVKVDMLTGGFRTGTSLEGLRPGIQLASRRIAKAVDLTQLVPAEPSLAVHPTEGAKAEDVTAITGSVLPKVSCSPGCRAYLSNCSSNYCVPLY